MKAGAEQSPMARMGTDFLPLKGTSVPATALRAENRKLFRGGVGEDFGGDFLEGVCSLDAYSKVWIGELVEQQWHGYAGLLAILTKCPCCVAPEVGCSRLAKTICQSRDNQRRFAGQSAQRVNGIQADLRIAVVEAVHQHRDGESCVSFKTTGFCHPARHKVAVWSIGLGKHCKKRRQPVFSDTLQRPGGAKPNGEIRRGIQHFGESRDGRLGAVPKEGQYKPRGVRPCEKTVYA